MPNCLSHHRLDNNELLHAQIRPLFRRDLFRLVIECNMIIVIITIITIIIIIIIINYLTYILLSVVQRRKAEGEPRYDKYCGKINYFTQWEAFNRFQT